MGLKIKDHYDWVFLTMTLLYMKPFGIDIEVPAISLIGKAFFIHMQINFIHVWRHHFLPEVLAPIKESLLSLYPYPIKIFIFQASMIGSVKSTVINTHVMGDNIVLLCFLLWKSTIASTQNCNRIGLLKIDSMTIDCSSTIPIKSNKTFMLNVCLLSVESINKLG